MSVSLHTKLLVKKFVGKFLAKTDEGRVEEIDVVTLFRILKIIRENPGVSKTELFSKYREKYGVKVNYNKIKTNINYAVRKGLVEVKGSKPARLGVTRKGLDYLYLLMSVERLLEEHIA